jgi:hypothetical protein
MEGVQCRDQAKRYPERFTISQPTVSRYCKKALEAFELSRQRQDGEWELLGDQTFL